MIRFAFMVDDKHAGTVIHFLPTVRAVEVEHQPVINARRKKGSVEQRTNGNLADMVYDLLPAGPVTLGDIKDAVVKTGRNATSTTYCITTLKVNKRMKWSKKKGYEVIK